MDLLAALNIVLLYLLMAGLGCTVDPTTLRRHLCTSPRGVLVALCAQCIVLPALAASVARAAGLAPPFAVGLVVVCCCPGGAISNILCLFFQADVALSVACTTASSTVAVAVRRRRGEEERRRRCVGDGDGGGDGVTRCGTRALPGACRRARVPSTRPADSTLHRVFVGWHVDRMSTEVRKS